MSGTPAAETILFIAAVVAAGLIAGSLGAVSAELSSGMEDRADALGAQLRGRFDIVNDPSTMPYTDPVLTVYIKNTGAHTFYAPHFVILIDGVASNDLTFTIAGASTEVQRPGELLRIDVGDAGGLGGIHRLSVIADNGHKETMEFTI